MSTATNGGRTDVFAILRYPSRAEIYLVHSRDGWTLPRIVVDSSLWIRARRELNHALQAKLGLPVTALYCAYYNDRGDGDAREVVYVLENHQDTQPEIEGQWLNRDQIDKSSLAMPHHRPVIETYLDEIEHNAVPALRPPWSRPGWFAQASAWIEQELARHGYDMLSPVEYVNNWCLSCILCAATSRGDVYFKASPELPLFVNEPVVVSGLANLFPDNIARPLSVDSSRRWMILEDVGPHLAATGSVDERRAMLGSFAKIQQGATAHVTQLLDMGCLDRRLPRLKSQIEGLAVDPDLAGELSDVERRQLQTGVATLQAMCDALSAFGIPETLNHGDLHLGNVAQRGGRLLFFDWTDACISHPFLDMISIFDEKDEVLRSRLRDDYLAMWTDHATPRQLRSAWALAEPLSSLHQAVSYQSILRHMEEPSLHGFGDVLPHYVRRALASVP